MTSAAMKLNRLYYRGPFSILPVLAERDWRLSVLESDNSIIPQNPPKMEASDWCHKGVVIVYICLLCGQPIRGLHFGGKLDESGIAVTLYTLNLPSLQIFSVWSS